MKDYIKIFEVLNNRRDSIYRVEFKDEEGNWWELNKDQPIRLLWEYELRIVEK